MPALNPNSLKIDYVIRAARQKLAIGKLQEKAGAEEGIARIGS